MPDNVTRDESTSKIIDNDVNEIIDKMENLVIEAKSVPFTSNCMVGREELLILIGMLRDNLPLEIKQAHWLLDNSNQIISEARKEAEGILRKTEQRVATMIDENAISVQAKELSLQTIQAANQSARQIRTGALNYANSRLSELEDQLTGMLLTVQRNKKELE